MISNDHGSSCGIFGDDEFLRTTTGLIDRVIRSGVKKTSWALTPTEPWTWQGIVIFEVVLCAISLFVHVVGSMAPQLVLTIPKNGFSVGSGTLLILAGSLLPAALLVTWSQECRAALIRFDANWGIYVAALLIGIFLPVSGYIGSEHSYPVWDSGSVTRFVRVFVLNLVLSPLWEEIIWRAYFYQRLKSMFRTRQAILVGATGWTIWHVGYLFYLSRYGIKERVLAILTLQIFLAGVIACCLFTLSRRGLGTCVLFHGAFNASTAIYYGAYGRVSDTGSYIGETTVMLTVAAVLIRTLIRRERRVAGTTIV